MISFDKELAEKKLLKILKDCSVVHLIEENDIIRRRSIALPEEAGT